MSSVSTWGRRTRPSPTSTRRKNRGRSAFLPCRNWWPPDRWKPARRFPPSITSRDRANCRRPRCVCPGRRPGQPGTRSPGRDEPPHVVGFFARDHGAVVPGRLISSAKSWLCHSGVDRTAALLPWHGAADVQRLSPVEVSSRYLAHVRAAWDAPLPAASAGRAGFRAHAAGLV